MRFAATVALALLFLSIEAVITRELGLDVARLDITLVLVVFLGLRAATLEGAFAAFAIGYLLDVFTGRPTGLYPFLAVLTFLLTRMLSSFVDARARGLFAVVCAGAALGHGLLAAFFSWLTSRSGSSGTFISLTGLPLQALLCLGAAALMWPLLRKLDPAYERPQAGMLR
jgi:rod shape-determining protein MreD